MVAERLGFPPIFDEIGGFLLPKIKKHRAFLSYDEQLKRIEEKNIKITNREMVFEILRSVSYYGIINGYKDIYGVYFDEKKELEVFQSETSFEDMYLLYRIDTNLNNMIFKYIIAVEKSLKTKLAYTVAKNFGIYEDEYLDYRHYGRSKNLDRRDVIKSVKKQIATNKNSASLQHYKKEHDCIPPWIATGALYYGTAINWYKIQKSHIKQEIASDFLRFTNLKDNESQKELLVNTLSLLQEYRNNIAHGNRTFLSNVANELSKRTLLDCLPDGVLTEKEYLNGIGKKDLFAVMLAIPILLNEVHILGQYVSDLKTLFIPYKAITQKISPKGTVFQTLNVPDNYLERLTKIVDDKLSKMSVSGEGLYLKE